MDGATDEDFVGWLRQHAEFCETVAAPLYGVLLRGMADDYATGGTCRELFAGWAERSRSQVVQLRALGALHRVVLSRQAPELATYYRSVGGTADPATAWPVARSVIAQRQAELAAALDLAPQTNEPGRAVGLAAGITVATARHGLARVRLLELGASAGLNLLVDRFRITAVPADGVPAWGWGPAGSPVDLAGAVGGPGARALPSPAGVRIVARRGCDLHPVDPLTEPGRLWLTSFVWPDHTDRHRRLAGALALAAAAGPRGAPVDRADAVDWLRGRLGETVEDGVLTVVWHSVFWQYLDDATRAALAETIAAARPRIPLAHLRLESGSAPYHVDPSLTLDDAVLGWSPPHGVPLTVLAPSIDG